MRTEIVPIVGALIGTLIAWIGTTGGGSFFNASSAARVLEVRSIAVASTRVGLSPQVRVDRTIHRAVTAEWTVTLRRELGEGFATFCSRNGRNDYREDAVLPPTTSLEWWMEIPANPPCPPIPPGNYFVTMSWTLEMPDGEQEVVRAESNVFQVTQ